MRPIKTYALSGYTNACFTLCLGLNIAFHFVHLGVSFLLFCAIIFGRTLYYLSVLWSQALISAASKASLYLNKPTRLSISSFIYKNSKGNLL